MAARSINLAFGVLAVAMVAAFVAATIGWWRGRDRPDASRAVTAESIVLLGDSITFGGEWDVLLPDVAAVNHGHPGHTTEQLVPVAREIAAAGPRAVLVMTGTNDVRDGRPPSWTVDHLERILDVFAARTPATVVVVQSILPRAEKAAEIVATNASIRALADARAISFVDLHARFDAGDGGLRPDDTTDGWHLSEAGYRRWAQLLAPVVAGVAG